MKRNNKLISILLTIILSLTFLSACGDENSNENKNYLKGTEAAKLLLANTRLDENFASDSFNMFKENNQNDTFKEKIYLSSNSPDYENDGVEAKWNNFPNVSSELQAVNATIKNLENNALILSKTINEVKRSAGITNVWLPLNEITMLIVEENAEVLLRKYNDTEHIVGRRYINDDGYNEYKMVETYDYGTVNTSFIPGRYYESMYQHESGFNDWFILDNSRGYWNFLRCNEFDYEEDENDFYQISNAMLLEDFCIKFNVHYYKNGKFEKKYISFTSKDISNDIFTFSFNESGLIGSFNINANAVSGIDYYSTPVSNVSQRKYTEDLIVPVASNFYNVSLTTKNGLKIEPNTKILENVSYAGTEIDFPVSLSNLEDGENYKGISEFSLKENITVDDLIPTLKETLDYLGLTPKYDINKLSENVSSVHSMIDNFNAYYKWNGLNLNNYQTIDNIFKNIIPEHQSKFIEVYNENKDNETYTKEQIIELKELNPNANFTKFNTYVDGTVKLENNVITIENASASIKDLTYCDDGKNYALRYGIAKVVSAENVSLVSNKGGINLISSGDNIKLDDVWFLPLHFNQESLTLCSAEDLISGNTLKFNANANFNLPEYLPQGEYVFVSYIAEVVDGIRITEFKPVNFESAKTTEITSDIGKYVASQGEDKKLYFNSETSLDIVVLIENAQQSYTYEEVYKLLSSNLLSVGLLINDAKLEIYNTTLNAYEEVSDINHVFTNEKIRIKFNRKTPIGNEVAYAYCELYIS